MHLPDGYLTSLQQHQPLVHIRWLQQLQYSGGMHGLFLQVAKVKGAPRPVHASCEGGLCHLGPDATASTTRHTRPSTTYVQLLWITPDAVGYDMEEQRRELMR